MEAVSGSGPAPPPSASSKRNEIVDGRRPGNLWMQFHFVVGSASLPSTARNVHIFII